MSSLDLKIVLAHIMTVFHQAPQSMHPPGNSMEYHSSKYNRDDYVGGYVSKDTVVLHWWKQMVIWLPYRDLIADVLSVKPFLRANQGIMDCVWFT